ncbi:hypothetical protein [Maribellus mangrovi]|uniref:hypothetical protein n=1 Tax=Maribellus mangrovi TaxID=3133146 RepID=UPI0030ECEDB8
MKNLLTLLICLIPSLALSQIHMMEIVDTTSLDRDQQSCEDLTSVYQEDQIDWFDILKTNLYKTEKSGNDTIVVDSTYTFHFYTPVDSVLVLKQYANYFFDENKILLSRFQMDSLSGEWLHVIEDVYYYDDFGNETLNVTDVKDTINNTWVHDKKVEHDFDINGNEIYYAFYRWNDSLNIWIGSSKTVRNYDEQNHLLLREIYEWDSDSIKWDMVIKHEYAFDSKGNKILDVSYGRDWQTNVLTPSNKYEYQFDGNGNKIMGASYSWNKEKEQWRGTSKSESVYDDFGNSTLSYDYTWDNENDKWKYWQKSTKTFTETGYNYELYFWDDGLLQWYGASKVDLVFSTLGKDSISIEYEWSFEDTVWYKRSKTEYSYYKPELYPLRIIYKWSREINDWELDRKIDLDYDESDRLILEAYYNWNDSLQAWIGESKNEIFYNSNGDRTATIYYGFDTEVWKIIAKSENIYDDHGSLIFSKVYNLHVYADTLRTISKTKYEITYDSVGNQTSYAEFDWDFNSNSWYGIYKTEKLYDSSNRIISVAGYSWDYEKEDWKGGTKKETSYDKNGNETSKTYIYWNQATNNWMPNSKTETYYNNDNERTKLIDYDWNELTEAWEVKYSINYTKYNYVFDDNNNLTLLEYLQWDENLLEWRAYEKYYFYYSTHQMNPTGILSKTNEKSIIHVYPNPFSERLFFEFSREESDTGLLEIFDATGRKIAVLFDQNINKDETYRVEYMPNNIATNMIFYRLTYSDEVINGKLVYRK